LVREGEGTMSELFDPEDLPVERKKHPQPVMMKADEILSLQRAAHIAGRSTRRVRDLGDEFGISRQARSRSTSIKVERFSQPAEKGWPID
jgi:hypothetical protein